MTISDKKKKLIIEPISVKLLVEPRTTVLESLETAGFTVNAVCGGSGTCGQCKIQISSEHTNSVSALTSAEKKVLSEKELKNGYRLACQTEVLNDIRVYLTTSFLQNNSKILHEADKSSIIYPEYDKLPRFWKVKLDLTKFGTSAHRDNSHQYSSDFELVREAIQD